MAVTAEAVAAALPERLGADRGYTADVLTNTATVALALIGRQGTADLPESVELEAAIRATAYMLERPAAVADVQGGEVRAGYPPGHLSALRHSGALAILGPWKQRRAGVCDA